jgi:glycosyltransferase involved in cell wall biosynthesis
VVSNHLHNAACRPDGASSHPPLLVFADDWGRHPSSCQHLIRRVRSEVPVLWVNTVGTRQVKADGFTFRRGLEKLKSWGKGLRQVDRQMWTIDLPMLPGMSGWFRRMLNRHLVTARLRTVLAKLGLEAPVIMTTLPYVGWLVRGLRRRGLVYYCTDDYSHWPSADRLTLQEADRDLSGEADLILAASHALRDQHAWTGRCEYFPHGVDFTHFASVQSQPSPDPAVAGLPGPRIGFFGLIYEKLDFDLLTAVARHFENGSLILIGPQVYAPPEFRRLSNVHLLGQKAYDDLPTYLAGLDVLMLPYVDDPMIRRSGPLKLRECLASGKPTVSIDLPDVRALHPHVRVASDRDGFVQEVCQALQELPASPAARDRQRVVETDGWDSRAQLLRGYLDELKPGRRSRPALVGNGQHPKRRILHLRTVSGRGGGPEKTILNSPRFLQHQYQMRLAYIRPSQDAEYNMPERARNMGVDLADIPECSGVDFRTLWRLAREIKAFCPDLLHAHDYKTNILSVLLGRWYGVPVVTTMHGYVTRGGRLELYYRLDRWALRRMDHVIAVSEDLQKMALDLGVPPARCSFVPNAIDAEQFARRHSVAAAKQQQDLYPGRPLIGAVGRLAPEKGFDLLIRAVDQLLRTGLDLELRIVGEGEERPRLEALIRELDRADRIRLLGYRSDVRDFLETLDILALSSLREGLPNAVLEAMAMEVPVVATRVSGVPGLIDHGMNGLLIEPGSLPELTQGLARLVGDSGLRDRLRRAGRATVESRYDFVVRMNRVRAIYDSTLKGRSCRI